MSGYPTDEELIYLIEQLEGQELYAPAHLKNDILDKAFPKQTVEVLPKSKSGRKGTVTLFTYRLKIVAGMAAAVVMLVIIPFQQDIDNMSWTASNAEQVTEETQELKNESNVDIRNLFNEGSRKVDLKVNSWFNKAINWNINNLNNENNGGNNNEN